MATDTNNSSNAQQTNVQQSGRTSVGVKVTTKTETTGIGEGLHMRPWYFVTIPGGVKLVQVLLAIICMGCASPVLASYAHFFMFVVATCFIVTVILCFVYFFSIQELAPNIPWLHIELLYTGGAILLYVIASIVQLVMTSTTYKLPLQHHRFFDAYIAAGVFALFNVIAYGVGAVFLLRDWRQARQVN